MAKSIKTKFTIIKYNDLVNMLAVLARVGVKKLPADEAKIRFIGENGKITAVANGLNVGVEIAVADSEEEFDIAVSYKKLKSTIGAYPECSVVFNREKEKVEVYNGTKVAVRFPISYNSSQIYRINKDEKEDFASAKDFVEAFGKVSGLNRGGESFSVLSGVYIEKNEDSLGSVASTRDRLMFNNYEGAGNPYVVATDTFINLVKLFDGKEDFNIQKNDQNSLYFEQGNTQVYMAGYTNNYPRLNGLTPEGFNEAELAVIIKRADIEETMNRGLTILGGDAYMFINLVDDTMEIIISSDDSEIKEEVKGDIEILTPGNFPESVALSLGNMDNILTAFDIVKDNKITLKVNRNSTLIMIDNSYYGIISNKARLR